MTGCLHASQGSMAGVAPLPSSQADRLLSPDTGSQPQTSQPPGLQERNLYFYNVSYSALSILLEQQKKTLSRLPALRLPTPGTQLSLGSSAKAVEPELG